MAGRAVLDFNGGEFFIKLYNDENKLIDAWEVSKKKFTVTPAAKTELLTEITKDWPMGTGREDG